MKLYLRSPTFTRESTPEGDVKRHILYLIAILPLITAGAGAADDFSVEADRILRGAAEEMGAVYGALDERTVFLFAGMYDGGEFEEFEILERLARSDEGREAVAEACRRAMAGDDTYLRLVAYSLLAESDPDEAAGLLPGFYESMSDDDIFLLMTVAETALSGAPEEGPTPGVDALYGLLERDLLGDDKAARVKAAKVIALTYSDRGRALAELGLQSPDPEVRRWCIMGTVRSPIFVAVEEPGDGSDGTPVLERALADEDASVRAFAARQVGSAGDPAYVPQLLGLLEDEDVSVRRGAASSLSTLLTYVPADDKKGAAKKILNKLKAEPDGLARCNLAEAYGAATATEEGCGRYLSDDGCWAFFAGEWREGDLESYFETYDSGWGGG